MLQNAELIGGKPQRFRNNPTPLIPWGQVEGESAFVFAATGPIRSAEETARLAILYRRLIIPYLEGQLGMTIPGWPTLQVKGQIQVGASHSFGWIGGLSYANIDLGTIGRQNVLRRHQLTFSSSLPATWRPSKYFALTAAPRVALFASVGDGLRGGAEPAFAINLEGGSFVGAQLETAMIYRQTGIVDGAVTLSYFQRFD